MARARNIKPGFFKNEDLAELEPFDRLLFAGLWMLCDREGRLEDRPKKIKMELFPLDNYDVKEGISRLVSAGFLNRYEVEEFKVISVNSFLDHQKPHGTEKDSKLPCENGFLTVNERTANGYITGKYEKISVIPQLNNTEKTEEEQSSNSEETEEEQKGNSSLTVNSQLDNTLNPESLITESLNPDLFNTENPNGGEVSPKPEAPSPNIWAIGVPMLINQGNSEGQARGFIGKLIKKHGEENTATAFAVASTKQPAELKGWLTKFLNNLAKPKPSDSIHNFDDFDYGFGVAADGSF